MCALLAISAWFLAVLYLGLENLYDLSKADLAGKKRYNHSFHTFFFMNTYLHVVILLTYFAHCSKRLPKLRFGWRIFFISSNVFLSYYSCKYIHSIIFRKSQFFTKRIRPQWTYRAKCISCKRVALYLTLMQAPHWGPSIKYVSTFPVISQCMTNPPPPPKKC